MTQTVDEKKAQEVKKRQRVLKFMNGANYSNRLIRNFNNLKKRENNNENKFFRTTQNLRKNLLNNNEMPSKEPLQTTNGSQFNRNNIKEFVPFVNERDGMGKLISELKEETRKVKIIRLNTRARYREKDFSNSVDMKNSLTHFVYENLLEKVNTLPSASLTHTLPEQFNYCKFEIKRQFAPFCKPPPSSAENHPMNKSFQPRSKPQTPCIGSYDYSTDFVNKHITRNFIFPREHADFSRFKAGAPSMQNLSDIYQRLDNVQKHMGDFGRQLGRSQTLLKWAPAIHETEKLKNKKKERDFKETDSKDLERDYHFNRYLQKKYFIKNYVPPFTQNVKRSIPLSKEAFKEKTTKLIEKYDFKTSLPEFKRIFKMSLVAK